MQTPTYIKQVASLFTITFITLGLVIATLFLPFSLAKFNVSQDIFEQHNFMDAYYAIYNHSVKSTIRPGGKVVIVTVPREWNRKQLAACINHVAKEQPAAIGVDILFPRPAGPFGADLVEALTQNQNMVVVEYLKEPEKTDWQRFTELEESFFQWPERLVQSGYSNVIKDGVSKTIRAFGETLYLNDVPMQSFTDVLAGIALPEEYAVLKKRKREREYINYKKDFIRIEVTDSLNYDTAFSSLKDKIVLISVTTDPNDIHATPLDTHTEGIMIHASVLSTIADKSFINYMSQTGAWILGGLVVFMFALLRSFTSRNEWLTLFMPVPQFALILIGIFLGYWIFIRFYYYINFIYMLIGLGIVGFVYDIYYKYMLLLNVK